MKRALLIILAVGLTHLAFSQLDSNFSKFLIIKSQSIDYYPVWGETDDVIYINLLSQEWRKYDLSKAQIGKGAYGNHDLGINTGGDFTVVTDTVAIAELAANTDWKPRHIEDLKKNKISLYQVGFSAALSINDEKIMNIEGNAHSLAVSPSGKYVACLFELTGLMIFDIEKELADIKRKKETVASMTRLEKVEHFLEERDLQSFEATLNDCTKAEKKTVEYNYYFGFINCLKSEQDSSLTDIAIKHLSEACEDSRFYESNVFLSALFQQRRDWENSLKYAEKAIVLIPDHPTAYILKGDYYENKGDTDKACEFYQKALEKGDQWVQLKLMRCK